MSVTWQYVKKIAIGTCLGTWLLFAQAAEGPGTGVIEALQQDEGYLVVSGRRLPFNDEYTRVLHDGRPLAAHYLVRGMVIRYRLGGDGTLQRIEVLGPAELLRALERH